MKFTRRAVTVVVLVFLAAPLGTPAQQSMRVPRVGFLSSSAPSEPTSQLFLGAFRQGLGELGYVEGQNIALESRWAEGKYERLPDLAAELVRLKVDVIVATTSPAVQAAKEATTTIPIVMAYIIDPVATGFVVTLARPGGNITGLSMMAPDLVRKQMELLNEVVPKISRVAILWNPVNPAGTPQLRETEVAARALGVRLQPLEARGPQEIDSAFAAMSRAGAGALVVLGDAMLISRRTQIVALTAKRRMPAVYGQREYAEAGGLMAYSANRFDSYRRAAVYVDKILKGTKPADLPIEQPTKFELVVNMKTAKALGLTIPPALLLRADHLIE
jgi:putative ABC transport system substrate-binding protein